MRLGRSRGGRAEAYSDESIEMRVVADSLQLDGGEGTRRGETI
jgi:hypothetical protein